MINEVFEFLESRDKYGSQPGLDRIISLLELLGNPEDKVDTIHIAGTNGKGSTGAYLESVFHHLQGTPHLLAFTISSLQLYNTI